MWNNKLFACAIVAAGCATLSSGCGDFRDCRDVDISAAEQLPIALSETGLYADIASDTIAAEAIAFTPRFPLWTDGADKRRWLILPAGTQVDTSDQEHWEFPVGTRLFKEFTRDGVRVETRMNIRNEDQWTGAAYLWDEGQVSASRTLQGIDNGMGTAHDVPTAGQCLACHGGRSNFVLGLSATQLDVETRRQLYDDGVLSDPVELDPEVDDTALAGLGYLHANCSHCHNEQRQDAPQATDCFDPGEFDFTLPADLASVKQSPAYQSAPIGKHDDSDILDRMSDRNTSLFSPSMPPLGTELVDHAGLAAVRALIMQYPAD